MNWECAIPSVADSVKSGVMMTQVTHIMQKFQLAIMQKYWVMIIVLIMSYIEKQV